MHTSNYIQLAFITLTGVFNTEAHPFQAPPAKASYGSGKLIQTPTMELPFTATAPKALFSSASVLDGH